MNFKDKEEIRHLAEEAIKNMLKQDKPVDQNKMALALECITQIQVSATAGTMFVDPSDVRLPNLN